VVGKLATCGVTAGFGGAMPDAAMPGGRARRDRVGGRGDFELATLGGY